jgi:hypothetical protein
MTRDINWARAIGIGLLTIGTIGTFKLAIDAWRLGLYPWQTPSAEIQAPLRCNAIVYPSPPPAGSPTCQATEVAK